MAALGIEQNKAESELKQAALEEQQHSVIQPLACAPEHCVYICNLTYPLGSHKTPHPLPAPLPPSHPYPSTTAAATFRSGSLPALVPVHFFSPLPSRSVTLIDASFLLLFYLFLFFLFFIFSTPSYTKI